MTVQQMGQQLLLSPKGIEIAYKDKKEEIFADREVIISCGSINSPQLLMLSGIGNASELQKLNIEVKHNLPGVGKNLQDHLEIYTQFKCNSTSFTIFVI